MRQSTRVLIALALLMVFLGAFVMTLRIERQKTSDISDKLADLDRRAAAQVSELQQQLSDEQAKAGVLDSALIEAREQLARNDDQRQSDHATATDAVAKLQTERQRAAALADKIADSEARAAAKLTDLQQRLETEKARTAGLETEQARAAVLEHDLEGARQQLARVDDRQRSAEAAVRDARAESQAQRQQAAGFADKLADTERRSTAETKDLQERLDRAEKRAASLDLDLAEARLLMIQAPKVAEDPSPDNGLPLKLGPAADDSRPATHQAQTPAQPPAEQATIASPKLEASVMPAQTQTPRSVPPGDVPARIVLRYALGSESAKAHAQSAELLLQAQGLHIEEPASPAKGLSASKVTFYYKEDQAIAKKICDALAPITGLDTMQKPPMSLKPLPRPGTIEIVISG